MKSSGQPTRCDCPPGPRTCWPASRSRPIRRRAADPFGRSTSPSDRRRRRDHPVQRPAESPRPQARAVDYRWQRDDREAGLGRAAHGLSTRRTRDRGRLSATAINVLVGPAALGLALVSHPDVRAITFTGGGVPPVRSGPGRHSSGLVMELGGNSANILFEDADLELAAANVFEAHSPTAVRAATRSSGSSRRPPVRRSWPT